MGTLADIYTKHGTDKGETGHHYGDFYEPYFSRYVNTKASILELGVWTGDSLAAHDEYFGDADIWGVDIDLSRCGNRFVGKNNIHLVKKDSNEINYFKDLFNTEVRFDIIIDDASHRAQDQMNNLYNFRQFLKKDGVYVLEDLHCSFDPGLGCSYDNSPLRFLLEQHPVSYLDRGKQEEILASINKVYIYSKEKDRNCSTIFNRRTISSIILFK